MPKVENPRGFREYHKKKARQESRHHNEDSSSVVRLMRTAIRHTTDAHRHRHRALASPVGVATRRGAPRQSLARTALSSSASRLESRAAAKSAQRTSRIVDQTEMLRAEARREPEEAR